MATVTDRYEHVVGIDTHARTHTYCIIESRTGAMVDTKSFPTTAPGMQRVVSWIRRRTHGTEVLAAVEGTSSYGAGITTALLAVLPRDVVNAL
ncbi:IS110 family transposase [Kocuria sp. JC486]|nr:IS110 family transposase [Kocuria sp. JC486]